jgi:hypothetical protein
MSEVSETEAGHPLSAEQQPLWRIIPSTEWLEEQQANDQHVEEFWGRFLPRGAAMLLVGEASAGKTVFLHRLSRALAAGEEFLGLKPPRPLRVLHVDLESPEALRTEIVDTIGPVPSWEFVKIDPSKLHEMLRINGPQYDVIIVDSLQVASPVKDENDNGEANRQMGPFVELAHKFGVTIILAHNAGEGNPKEKFKSRGATARVDRADLGINLDETGPGKRRLKVVKSRYGNLSDTIEFEFAGELDYKLTKPAQQPATKEGEMAVRILRAIPGFGPAGTHVERKALADHLGIRPEAAEQRCFERALAKLVKGGRLESPSHGIYALPKETDKSDNPTDPRVSDMSGRAKGVLGS